MSVRSTSANMPIGPAVLTCAFLECQEELVNFFKGRIKCPETARDLSQEVYLRLQRVEDPDSISNHRTYIFKVARNLMIDHVRTETRRSNLLEQAGTIPWEGRESPTPEQAAIARNDLDTLRRVIPALPAVSRQIFHSHRFEKKTRQQIADEHGVSLTTVENHIRLVLEHFSRALTDKDPQSD